MTLPDAFYSFARVDERAIPYPLQARFGDTIELLGYDYTVHNAVHAQQIPATVATYWRPLRPLDDEPTLSLFFSRHDGAIVYHYDGPTAASLWYPAHRWQVGEVIRVETPILYVGRLRDVMAAVTPPGKDFWSPEQRLVVDAGDQSVQTYDQGTLLRLFSFR
jgi:hypothetical protein